MGGLIFTDIDMPEGNVSVSAEVQETAERKMVSLSLGGDYLLMSYRANEEYPLEPGLLHPLHANACILSASVV